MRNEGKDHGNGTSNGTSDATCRVVHPVPLRHHGVKPMVTSRDREIKYLSLILAKAKIRDNLRLQGRKPSIVGQHAISRAAAAQASQYDSMARAVLAYFDRRGVKLPPKQVRVPREQSNVNH